MDPNKIPSSNGFGTRQMWSFVKKIQKVSFSHWGIFFHLGSLSLIAARMTDGIVIEAATRKAVRQGWSLKDRAILSMPCILAFQNATKEFATLPTDPFRAKSRVTS